MDVGCKEGVLVCGEVEGVGEKLLDAEAYRIGGRESLLPPSRLIRVYSLAGIEGADGQHDSAHTRRRRSR